MKEKIIGLAWTILLLIIISWLTSCTKTQYIEKEVEKDVLVDRSTKDSSDIVRLHQIIDSITTSKTIYMHDSIVIVKDTAGTEVRRQEWHNTWRDNNTNAVSLRKDTVRIYTAIEDSSSVIDRDESIVTTKIESKTTWQVIRDRIVELIVCIALVACACYCIDWCRRNRR